MAIPALPGAVERAYIVLPHIESCLVSVSRFRGRDDECRKGCLRIYGVQQLEPRDTRHGRELRAQLPPCCFKRIRMLLLARQTAFRLIDLDNVYVSLLLKKSARGSR
jgi:hypothetical protein